MKNTLNTLILSILAGILISFGGIIYLMSPNKIIGSLLFSFGLATIVCQGYALYTGRIGYFQEYGLKNLLTTIIGNFIGTTFIGILFQHTRLDLLTKVQPILETKLNDSLVSFFILSIGCGAMMFLAVDNFKKSKAWFLIIMPIMIFILSGFEHSIANMFYYTIGQAWSLETFGLTVVAIVGNAFGSWLVNKSLMLIAEK